MCRDTGQPGTAMRPRCATIRRWGWDTCDTARRGTRDTTRRGARGTAHTGAGDTTEGAYDMAGAGTRYGATARHDTA